MSPSIYLAKKATRNERDLRDRIELYGGFLDGLEFCRHHLQSTSLECSTILIRGDVGTGKKSLMKQVEKLYLKSAITVYVDPYLLTDDFSALKYIASKLALPRRLPLHEISELIKGYKKRIVIVLLNFEDFCRKRQSLLYCLTDFVRNGNRINIIGLTTSLDCTASVEKRVRSRLTMITYDLSPPYRNLREYFEFASILLDNYAIDGPMKEQLKILFYTSRSIRVLKRYLRGLCHWSDGELIVNQPPPSEQGRSPCDTQYLELLLDSLTKPQYELLVVAVRYCKASDTLGVFKVSDLDTFTKLRNYDKFDSTSALTFKNIKVLTNIGLLKPLKLDVGLNHATKFILGIMPEQLESVMSGRERSDGRALLAIWRELK